MLYFYNGWIMTTLIILLVIASKNRCDVAAGTGYKILMKMLMITRPSILCGTHQMSRKKTRPSRPQRRSIFQGDGMVNVFFRPPLPSMVFQWFWQSWTITIECFLGGPTIGTNGFSMVFKILRAMVNNGFEVNDGVPGQDHITKWW